MADIKQVFSDEVRRLARKEVKLAVVPLLKLVAEQKQLIRELKRELAAVKKDLPENSVIAVLGAGDINQAIQFI